MESYLSPASPQVVPQEDRLVAVGSISRPHGIKGEIRLNPEPGVERVLAAIKTFYVRGPQGIIPLRPRRVRWSNKYVIMGFDGYRSRNEAERLKGLSLYVDAGELPDLRQGELYQYMGLGARMVTESGELLGTVVGIIDSSAHPILKVAGPKGEILFPVVPDFVISVSEDGREMVVVLPEGLIEATTKETPDTESE